jgi:tetratricopeptide (TPR) repeat protein
MGGIIAAVNDAGDSIAVTTAEILVLLTNAINEAPDAAALAEAYSERAWFSDHLDEHAKALQDYFEALDVEEDPRLRVGIKMQIALTSIRNNQLPQALLWSLDAINTAPENALARYVFGLICSQRGFFRVAIESLRRALELEPGDPDATLKLAECLREEFRVADSVEVLTAYVAEHPRDPRGLFELGKSFQLSFERMDRHERALDLYRQALDEDPPESLRWLIEYQIRDIRDVQSVPVDD